MHRSLEQPQASPKATGILLFLLLLNILNMVDRTLITSFGTAIITDLGLSDSQFGLLTGPIFVFFYSIMGLFMGALADRVHRPRLIAAGLVLWSALTAVSGVAKNFAQIGVARLFIGVGESAMAPSAISMISDMFPKAKRGTATGIYYLGVPLGAGASFIVAGILGPMIGWRNCFLLLGGLGLVLALVLLFIKDPERGAMEEKGTEVDQQESLIGGNWRSIVSDVFQVVKSTPALAWTMVGAVFLHIPLGAGQFAIVWLERERGFGIGEISATYGLVYIIFGTAGTFLGGILSDWYQARYRGGRVRFLALLMLAVTPLLILFRFVEPSSALFYIGMAAGMFSVSSFYGPAFSTVQDLTPVRLRGVMTGLLLVACNLLGLGIGAMMTGVLSDVFSANNIFEPLTKALLSADILSAAAPVSFIIASIYLEKMKARA
ncbi:MFS transporter [Porticoccaceae bacterium]|jgi:MFS family permease|nr:MFS transporter [Porticoccaceae bacterium]MBT6319738.1 MFS transporter [Porticoccaceae bacterium]MBT7258344.1 MFS transporter [Porticoccaceae bacterium]MBT7905467.1 MFS transporter [Porticoccaceae bacterium]MDA7816204.1 MFS transporter [Porticoccaceae bacterium]